MTENKSSVQKTQDINSPPYIKEIINKTYLKDRGSHREYVITTAVYIEDLLTKILKKGMVTPLNEANDELFGAQSALYNFGSKNHLAFRLGLISRDMHWVIDKIRSVRDRFAHSHEDMSLEDNEFKGGVVKDIYERISTQFKISTDIKKNSSGAVIYEDIVSGILLVLWSRYDGMNVLNESAQKEGLFK